MAVFYDTGNGDIYAGETKEACLAAMKEDGGEEEFDESDIFEVPGTAQMRVDELVTLDEEYTDMGHGYCIASSNC